MELSENATKMSSESTCARRAGPETPDTSPQKHIQRQLATNPRWNPKKCQMSPMKSLNETNNLEVPNLMPVVGVDSSHHNNFTGDWPGCQSDFSCRNRRHRNTGNSGETEAGVTSLSSPSICTNEETILSRDLVEVGEDWREEIIEKAESALNKWRSDNQTAKDDPVRRVHTPERKQRYENAVDSIGAFTSYSLTAPSIVLGVTSRTLEKNILAIFSPIKKQNRLEGSVLSHTLPEEEVFKLEPDCSAVSFPQRTGTEVKILESSNEKITFSANYLSSGAPRTDGRTIAAPVKSYHEPSDSVDNDDCLVQHEIDNQENILVKIAGSDRASTKENSAQKPVQINAKFISLVASKSQEKYCACRKSSCLRMYCACYTQSKKCEPSRCKCKQCKNTDSCETERKCAIQNTLKRDPDAFCRPSRQERRLALLTSDENGMSCRCQKSRCLKLYCGCFYSKKLCNSKCKCLDCENAP